MSDFQELPIPGIIYKYTKINQFLYNTLINAQLWFSSPPDFNDPYDCNIAFDRIYSREEIEYFIRSVRQESNVALSEDEIQKRVNRWDSDRSLIYKELIISFKKSVDSKGIFCLSAIADQMLLWSHYADNHYGICLGFSSNILNETFNFISWVKYSNEFPDVNLLINPNDFIGKIMLNKSTDWSYEKEIRIHQFSKGNYPFQRHAIKEVIFGLRTSSEQITTVMYLMLIAGYKDIVFKKVYIDGRSYKINFATLKMEITPASDDSLKGQYG